MSSRQPGPSLSKWRGISTVPECSAESGVGRKAGPSLYVVYIPYLLGQLTRSHIEGLFLSVDTVILTQDARHFSNLHAFVMFFFPTFLTKTE